MITIPEHTMMSIIQAAQESNRKIIGITIVAPETASCDTYGFAFSYKESVTGDA